MILSSIAPQFRGSGLSSGLTHRLRYVARLSNNATGQNGNSWVVTSLPYLHYSAETVDDMPEKVILTGVGGAQWEWVSGTGYVGLFGTTRRLDIDGANLRMLKPDGSTITFFGPSAASSIRGRQQGAVSALGIVTVVAYDGYSRIASETRTDPVSGDQAALLYTFATVGPHTGRILAVEKRLVRSGAVLPVHRWDFTYHSGADSAGSLNDLKTAGESVWSEANNVWASVGKRYFRYYTGDSGIGFVHGLRYVLDADGYARMEELGLDPEDASQVTDTVLAGFAAEYFEYDSDRRHSKEVARAGTETTTYARLNSDDDPARNWSRREIAHRPDGSVLATYFDRAGRTVFQLLESNGETWPEYREFNADNRETLHATASGIASFTEPANASQNFGVTLKNDAGLIETKDYYPASGGGAGSAPLRLKASSVKEGASGTAIKQKELTYIARTVGGDTIYKTADSIVYRDSAGGGSKPAITSNAYTWRGSTFSVLRHTVTPPVVGTVENGTGEITTRVTIYDDYGNARWRRNERGRIDYEVRDRLTGTLRFRIEDADTASLEDVPAGWNTASGFGSARRTDCQSDLLGRTTLILGPAHLVPTKNAEGTVEAILTRRAEFACYLDDQREIRSAKGGSTSGGLYTLGTASLRRLDYANRELQSIEAARACECGPLSPAEAFPQSSWKRWRREFYNAAAYRDESCAWHLIPASGEGFENVNYYSTRYGRDAMGRENRVKNPGGTITRTVFDARGLPLSEWMGTDDSGATDSDPSGGGATGNNMVRVTGNLYDGGQDGGNGNLTKRTRPVDDDSQNDREEEFDYDFRDRLAGEQYSDGTNVYFVRLTRDNLGQVVRTELYHTSVTSGNLTGRGDGHFDARGRNYKNETFSVDPETGAVGHALVGERWRDASGNVIKETLQGNKGFVKRAFDAFEREVRSYTACNPGGGSDNGDPANDTVVEQSENAFDAAGNRILRTAWQRFHDATGSGALNGPTGSQPRGRRTFLAWWRDAIGREIAVADYGTNGGSDLERPEVPPATSETVLVTRTRYASTGEPGEVIAPGGTVTRTKRNAIGQQIETVENFKEGAAPAADVNRTVRFGYHPGGGLETLTLVNAVTGDQVTRWVYGTTLAESGVATGHLLRAKIYPESDDGNAPLGDGPDGVYERTEHTYNRQGEVVTTKDPNETVHGYLRDKMGRLLHDRVTAFGDGIDDAVKRISTEYDSKRPNLIAKVTSHDDATPGQGNVLNEVGKAYDGFGQEIGDAQAHDGAVNGSTPKVGYGYENGSNNTTRRNSITYPDGRQVNLGYGAADGIEDLFSLVKSVAIQGESGNKVEYARVGLARFVRISYPQPGVEMSMIRPGSGSEGDSGDPYDGYDRFSRVQEMRWQNSSTGTSIDAWKWGFNQASNRTWKKNLVAASGQDEAYGYDHLHQVIRDAVGTLNTNRTAIGGIPGEKEDFIYDPTGNWLGYRKDEDGSTVRDQTRSNNKDNQLIQIDGSSALLAYDRAGNATKVPPGAGGDWTQCFQPVWDAWNRIVLVKDENGATVQKNAYDGLFRRITKESGGVVVHTYWSDRWKPLEERIDSATTATKQFLWGERPGHRDEIVLRDRDTNGDGTLDERLYATMDYFNGTAALNTSGVVQERYAYSAFGVRRVMAGNFSVRASSDFDWDFGFQGQFRDAETGWYNYGYRFYVSLVGRWINRDPIVEKGGVNLYLFVGNSPISDIDLLGLECSPGDTDISNLQLTINTPSGPVNGLNSLQELLGDKATDAGLETIEDFFGSVGDILKTIKDGLGRANMTSLRMAPTAIESVHFTADVKCCRCDDDSKAYWDTTEASGEAAPDGNLNLKPTVNEFVSLVNQAFDMLTRDIARQKEQCKD